MIDMGASPRDRAMRIDLARVGGRWHARAWIGDRDRVTNEWCDGYRTVRVTEDTADAAAREAARLALAYLPDETVRAEGSASARYVALVRGMGEEMRHRRGWKSEAARRLGVHQSFVSRVAAGKVRSIGADLIERARDRLGVDLYERSDR